MRRGVRNETAVEICESKLSFAGMGAAASSRELQVNFLTSVLTYYFESFEGIAGGKTFW